MKRAVGIIIILLFGSCFTHAQSPSHKVLIPEVDSMVVEMDKLFINPKNVKSLLVLKDATPELLRSHRGANLIMTFKKQPRLVPLNTLKTHTAKLYVSYIIDGVPVVDTAGAKIDLLNIKKLNVLRYEGTDMHMKHWDFVYDIKTKSQGEKLKQPK